MSVPDWYTDLQEVADLRTIQANDGVVWAVARSRDHWIYRERGGESESFETLAALVGRLSVAQQRLFGTNLAEARKQDAVFTLVDLLESGRRKEALTLLEDLVEPAESGTLPETEANACRRLAYSLRRTRQDVLEGKVRHLDAALAHVRLRLESVSEHVENEELIALLVEHDEERLAAAARRLDEMLAREDLALLTEGEAIEDYRSFAIKPGGPCCPELFANGRWAHIPLVDPVPHPECASIMLSAVPVPPPEIRGEASLTEFLRGPFAKPIKELHGSVARAARFRESGAPAEFLEREHELTCKRVSDVCKAATVPPLADRFPNERGDIAIDTPPPGNVGPAVAVLLRQLQPAGERLNLGDGHLLVQTPDEMRLYDEDGVVRTFPPSGWRLVSGYRNWAVFLGERPRVEQGEVREVAVLDVDTGEWRETWPTTAAVGHTLRSLDTLVIVEPVENGHCVTDVLFNRTRLIEPPDLVVAWDPLQNAVWGDRDGQPWKMRLTGGVHAFHLPDASTHVYDADAGELAERPRVHPVSVEPSLSARTDDPLFYITAEGTIARGGERVLGLDGDVVGVCLSWPVVAVLTPTHVAKLLVDLARERDGYEVSVMWRKRIAPS